MTMADELPTEYDAIVLGTGLPEAVVAAALSRIGYKVLHLDRNDYYAGYWASFSFDHLQEWIRRITLQDATSNEKTNDATSPEAANSDEKHLPIPQFGKAITNMEIQSFLRENGNIKEIKKDKSDVKIDGTEDIKRGGFAQDSHKGHEEVEPNEQVSKSGQETAKPVLGPETHSENSQKVDPCKETTFTDTETQLKGDQGNEFPPETTSLNPDPETTSEGDTDQPSITSNVINWAERRKMRKEMKLGRDATFKNLSEQSRKFNLDLAPKVLLSRGLLVESLINANIAHYAEFKIVSRILTYMNGNIEQVPCSRSDVFGSELITVLEKRALMRFITFCANFQDSSEEYLDFQDKPFIDFLEARKLTANLQHIIHAIAGVPQNATTLCGLKATQTFLQSLGRYGNTPYLWSLYGAGEVPQAFCRMCAVFGGIYCLRKNVNCFVYDEGCNKCVAVISDNGQRLNTKWIIMEKSYAPKAFELEAKSTISRAILITDKSLKPSSSEHVTLLSLPAKNPEESSVHVIELPPSSMASPESLFIVHFITEARSTALEDLQDYVKQLFTTAGEESDTENGKPAVLWAFYFNRKCFLPKKSCQLPENVKLTSLPSSQMCFEDAMNEAKSIFTSICPEEEFLLAVPNPEDIIWDDVNNAAGSTDDEQFIPDSDDHCETSPPLEHGVVAGQNVETTTSDGDSST